MAPQVGLEPTTYRLTAGCSTIELLWNLLGYCSRSQGFRQPYSRKSLKRLLLLG